MKIPILQIVGYQNSGKTTLMLKIIKKCVEHHLQIGTIKHHGHGGAPFLYDGNKDSVKHRQAGASVTTVEGEGIIELTSCMQVDVDVILQFYNHLNLDAILIEGYKNLSFPKIVLIKTHYDLLTLTNLSNIQAVITWLQFETKPPHINTIFSIHEEDLYLDWILKYLRDLHE